MESFVRNPTQQDAIRNGGNQRLEEFSQDLAASQTEQTVFRDQPEQEYTKPDLDFLDKAWGYDDPPKYCKFGPEVDMPNSQQSQQKDELVEAMRSLVTAIPLNQTQKPVAPMKFTFSGLAHEDPRSFLQKLGLWFQKQKINDADDRLRRQPRRRQTTRGSTKLVRSPENVSDDLPGFRYQANP